MAKTDATWRRLKLSEVMYTAARSQTVNYDFVGLLVYPVKTQGRDRTLTAEPDVATRAAP